MKARDLIIMLLDIPRDDEVLIPVADEKGWMSANVEIIPIKQTDGPLTAWLMSVPKQPEENTDGT